MLDIRHYRISGSTQICICMHEPCRGVVLLCTQLMKPILNHYNRREGKGKLNCKLYWTSKPYKYFWIFIKSLLGCTNCTNQPCPNFSINDWNLQKLSNCLFFKVICNNKNSLNIYIFYFCGGLCGLLFAWSCTYCNFFQSIKQCKLHQKINLSVIDRIPSHWFSKPNFSILKKSKKLFLLRLRIAPTKITFSLQKIWKNIHIKYFSTIFPAKFVLI